MNPHPNKKDVFDPEQARAMRKLQRIPKLDEEDEEEIDDEFQEKPEIAIEKSKEELKITKIKAQIDYFGYVLEPFNMNNEKKYGNIDSTGYFVYDKDKENEIRDPWLDALDLDPYKQGIEGKNENESAQLENSEFKEINKKGNIDVKKEDFLEIDNNDTINKKNEKTSQSQLIELAEKLIGSLEKNQTPNNLINKLRPSSSRQKVYKKNIRKNKKANQNNDLKIKEEDHEDEEKSEKFKEIIEICDILSSNGCLEIFAQTKEEIIEFTNEKLKKNFLMDQNFVNSDNEFKNENDLSESD